MLRSYAQVANEVDVGIGRLRDAMPDTMLAYSGLARAAFPNGALTTQTKELIALAIGVVLRCDGCIACHARRAAEVGVERDEVVEMLAVAVQMGGGPSTVAASQALAAYDELREVAEQMRPRLG